MGVDIHGGMLVLSSMMGRRAGVQVFGLKHTRVPRVLHSKVYYYSVCCKNAESFLDMQGWLPGLRAEGDDSVLPTIAIVASYDTFGAAPVSCNNLLYWKSCMDSKAATASRCRANVCSRLHR